MNHKSTFLKLFVVAATMCMGADGRAATGSVGTVSDDWMLTDALGRKACGYDVAGDRDDGRFVGMFYWTWHQGYDGDKGREDRDIEVKNITEVLRAHPEAINDYNHPAWGLPGRRPGVFYWDEPIFGYYRTTDPWVLRKHAEMLADAGVDAVFFDCTNGSLVWESSYRALLETWSQALKDGVNVPKIVFMLPFAATPDSHKSLLKLYKNLYSKGEYKDLWFYWKGKPLIMADPVSPTMLTARHRVCSSGAGSRYIQPMDIVPIRLPAGPSNAWSVLPRMPAMPAAVIAAPSTCPVLTAAAIARQRASTNARMPTSMAGISRSSGTAQSTTSSPRWCL